MAFILIELEKCYNSSKTPLPSLNCDTCRLQKETVKISVRFLSNEVRVDALDIKVFSKKCISFDDCSVLENKGVLIGELKKKILQKAAVYDTEIKAIQKKRRKVPKVKKVTKKQRRKKANKDKK